MHNRFLEILKLSKQGLNGDEIGRQLRMNNVRAFLTGRKKSFLTHLRAEHDRLGSPRSGNEWLPSSLKPRGVPGESWIQVPREIRGIDDVVSVMTQIAPNQTTSDMKSEFGYSKEDEFARERAGLFGFFIGAAIGDAGKHRKGESKFVSKAISLVLSKDKPNSYRFGEFTSLCARASLGLNMHRIADAPASKHRYSKAGCYRWISPASPLVGWVFHDCLGLRAGELTTYNPLKMDWLVDAPAWFKTAVLQGVSESDGWVDAGSDTVCLVSSPNTELFTTVLGSLGVGIRVDQQELVEVIRIPTEDAMMLPMFNPRIHSIYYEQMEIMSRAAGLPERIRLQAEVVGHIRELSSRHNTLTGVCLDLASKYGIKVSSQTVKKYIG